METITYSQKSHVLYFWTWVLAGGLSIVAVALRSFASGGLTEAWSQTPVPMWLYTFVVLAWILTMIWAKVYAIRPANNFMTLDESGLTYMRFGFRQRWAWRNLPEFSIARDAVYPHGPKWVEFRPPKAGDWRAYPGSWVVWLAGGWFARGRRIIRISDEYDAPLQEVADRLNEYRERALGSDAPTSEPSAAG